jgi:hypothetical protein
LFNIILEPWWLWDQDLESHYPHLFDKNQAQGNMSLYRFQDQMTFTWEDVLENNINYILESHLKFKLFN